MLLAWDHCASICGGVGDDELVAMRDLLVNMFDDCLNCERPHLYRPSSLGSHPDPR